MDEVKHLSVRHCQFPKDVKKSNNLNFLLVLFDKLKEKKGLKESLEKQMNW